MEISTINSNAIRFGYCLYNNVAVIISYINKKKRIFSGMEDRTIIIIIISAGAILIWTANAEVDLNVNLIIIAKSPTLSINV